MKGREIELEVLAQELTVCKVASVSDIALDRTLYFIGRTDGELSLVCEADAVPEKTLAREDGWRAFRVKGTLDFSLTGILARLSGVLAENGIGLFAVSTYDTDYILVKRENLEKALDCLIEAGYRIA